MHILTSLLLLSLLHCSSIVDASLLARAEIVSSVESPPSGEAFNQDANFNAGRYGKHVVQQFKSSTVRAPRTNMMKPFTNCDDGSYIFVTPRGEVPEIPTAVIYDASGSLIWTPNAYFGQIYNFQVQQYNESSYLTFWAGNDSVGGHGSGQYYMYNQYYELVQNISAVNGLGADLHSFAILPNGNAPCTAYEKIEVGAETVHGIPSPNSYWMWDSLFQEFSLETGELVY